MIFNTPKGDLEYRLPNIAEGYDFLCLVDSISSAADVFRVKASIIRKMYSLIDFKNIGYETYDELLNDKENMRDALSTISKEVFDDITELLGKKI